VTRRGETLTSIARRFHASLAELEAVNGLPARSTLPRGKVVLIPTHPRPERVASKKGLAKKGPPKAAARQDTASVSPTTYRVRGGDTLYRIALRNGTTVALLMTLNSLGTPAIRPGDVIKIPAKGTD
jgi:LysM repeat protein